MGMLYLSVVFESGSVKKLTNALSTCKKRPVNCGSIETAVSRGRHLIDGFVQNSVRQETERDKAETLTGTLCEQSECVMESAEREAYTRRASHVFKTQARGLRKADSTRMKLKTPKINFLVSFWGSCLYTNNFPHMYTTQLLDLQTYRHP